MKVEIEISDFEELAYCSGDGEITSKNIKKWIIDAALQKFVEGLYNDFNRGYGETSIGDMAKEIVRNNAGSIVESVKNCVAEEILRKKSIASEMPKKSEFVGVSKEWENYFIELIDKVIAKRFKSLWKVENGYD